MIWTNRACVGNLRCTAQEGTVYYTIEPHTNFGSLVLKTEDILLGKQLSHNKRTAKSIIKEFPELDEFADVLYMSEKIVELESHCHYLREENHRFRMEKK